jgi:membrane associated rhomboid family serine protease
MSWQSSDDTDYPRMTRVVQVLLAINIAVAFLEATVVQPAELETWFAFKSSALPWWTWASYMFLHAGLWHLAMNMYTLWIFGPRIEHLWGSRSFALFYIWCGLGGAVFHAIFVGSGVLIGASAAIFGVMLAYAMHWPKDEIYLLGVVPMKVSTLVGLMVAMNLFLGYTSGAGGVAYFAHLGGFAFAFLYLKKPQHVSIDQLRQRVSPAPDVGDDMSPRATPRPSSRSRNRDEVDEIVAQSKAAVKSPARVEPAKRVEPRNSKAEELDRVLDKISRHGLTSLTPGERKLLDEASKRLRD